MIRIILGAFLLLVNNSCANSLENQTTTTLAIIQQEENSPLQIVFNNYFELKDALVQTNPATASEKAKKLLFSIENIKTEELKEKEISFWLGISDKIKQEVKLISESKGIDNQRKIFVSLSNKMYQLRKNTSMSSTTYYQYCSMANNGKGAYWLSQESKIKNPYYGSEMLSCGTVKETIK